MAAKNEHIYLNTLLACVMVQECMEKLKGTQAYRHELKQKSSPFIKELDKIVAADIPKVWGVDDEIMYTLMEYQKDFIKAVSGLRPEDLGVITEILSIYEQRPAMVLKRLGIKLVDEVPSEE